MIYIFLKFLSSCETQSEISDSVFDFYEYETITSDEECPMTYDTLCVDHTIFNVSNIKNALIQTIIAS